MIKTLSVNNKRGKSRSFTLGAVNAGILLERVDGMDPINADLSFADLASAGVHFIGSHTGKRNPVLTFSLKRTPGKSMEAIRKELYTYFFPGRPVDLTVTSELQAGTISGYVESVSPSIFEKEPTLIVSIICMEPYIKNSLIGNQSIILPKNEVAGNLIYQGTVDTGLTIEITVGTVPSHLPSFFEFRESITGTGQNLSKSFTVSESAVQGASGIEGYRFQTGDVFTFNTTPGKKSGTLRRNGSTYNIFNAIRSSVGDLYLTEAQWPELRAFATLHSFRMMGDPSGRLNANVFTARVLWDTYFEGF